MCNSVLGKRHPPNKPYHSHHQGDSQRDKTTRYTEYGRNQVIYPHVESPAQDHAHPLVDKKYLHLRCVGFRWQAFHSF